MNYHPFLFMTFDKYLSYLELNPATIKHFDLINSEKLFTLPITDLEDLGLFMFGRKIPAICYHDKIAGFINKVLDEELAKSYPWTFSLREADYCENYPPNLTRHAPLRLFNTFRANPGVKEIIAVNSLFDVMALSQAGFENGVFFATDNPNLVQMEDLIKTSKDHNIVFAFDATPKGLELAKDLKAELMISNIDSRIIDFSEQKIAITVYDYLIRDNHSVYELLYRNKII